MANIPAGPGPDLSTDADWEAWGRDDPYFGVITDPRFRVGTMTEADRHDFFASGERHARHVMASIRRHVDALFEPTSILDFGCGVGRVLIPFSRIAPDVTGLDVSPSMLAEARRNCDAHGASAVQLAISDDSLSGVPRQFDLVHSFIVLQHLPSERSRDVFAALLARIAPGGAGAIHLSYSKRQYAGTHGLEPPPQPPPRRRGLAAILPPRPPEPPPAPDGPRILMNPVNMNSAVFAMQAAGIRDFHAEHTDHGGELGVFLFFRMPTA